MSILDAIEIGHVNQFNRQPNITLTDETDRFATQALRVLRLSQRAVSIEWLVTTTTTTT